jgi:hypothetical protein
VRNACLEAALNELGRVGIRDVTRSYGGKHQQIRFKSNGHERTFTLPVSPSDFRAAANTRSEIRKILRADGVLPTTDRRPPPAKTPDRFTRLEQRVAVLEQQLAALSKQMNGAS